MEFKKIDINASDFERIFEKTMYTYLNAECGEALSMKIALRENIFNVKEEFKENDWNCCTNIPPEKYQLCPLIIREKKDTIHYTKDYRLAYYSDVAKEFRDSHEKNPFKMYENLKDFEYKVIK